MLVIQVTPKLRSRASHLPASLAVLEAEDVGAWRSVRFASHPEVERLIAGLPRPLLTRHPAFAGDWADVDLGSVLVAGARVVAG